MNGATTAPRPAILDRAARWIVPFAILVPWLALLGSWQVPLFPPTDSLPRAPELWIAGVVVVAALIVRLAAPSVATHVLALAAITCGVSLGAAQIGSPLANATVDYCGDFCRTAIIGRFLGFFGWPAAVGVALFLQARTGRARWSEWTRPWAVVTLVVGLAAAVAWWRIILPNG